LKRSDLAILKATGAVTFWGASFTATKVAVGEVSPLTLLWMRFGIGILCLGLIMKLKKQPFSMPFKGLRDFALLGFIGIFLHNFIQSSGLRTAEASVSVVILASTPIVIAILGFIFLSENISLIQIMGILIAACGVVTVLSRGDLSVFLSIGFHDTGEILVIGSVFTWAIFSVFSKGKLRYYPPDLAMFFAMTSGWILASLPFYLSGGFYELPGISVEAWLSILFLGIFCSALGYFFWYDALSYLPASRVGIFLYLSPLVGVSVAALFLGENVTFSVVLGGIMILFGVAMVNYRRSSS